MFDNEDKSLAEQQLESQQRAYELGLRYGYLDARAGRPNVPHTAEWMGLPGPQADRYYQGWHESYDAYMADLNAPGHHLSVPHPTAPLDRIAVTTTGHTRTDEAGVMFVAVEVADSNAPWWVAVDSVRVLR